jgi:hypothetical protein
MSEGGVKGAGEGALVGATPVVGVADGAGLGDRVGVDGEQAASARQAAATVALANRGGFGGVVITGGTWRLVTGLQQLGDPGSARHRKTTQEPILEATDDVSGVASEKPQRGRRKARRIPFIADDEDLLLVAHGSVPVAALWIQPPLQNVAIDNERARNRPVALSLFERSYVNEERPRSRRAVGVPWLQAEEAPPRIIEERVNADTRLTSHMVC